MTKLKAFWNALEKHRLPKEMVRDRANWCHLLTKHNKAVHRIEVRYATYIKETYENGGDCIDISAVSWTLGAGPCGITIKEETVDKFLIEEDHPISELIFNE